VLLNSPSASLQFQSSVTPPLTLFPIQNVTLMNGVSFANDVAQVIAALTAPFSIVEKLTLGGLNGLGDNINFAGSTTLTPAGVPELSSLAFATVGGVCFIGYGLRRRKAPGA
jgi:hypothetical protein